MKHILITRHVVDVFNPTKGCKCPEWANGWPQIERAQAAGYLVDVIYTGPTFKYCPWCKRKLPLVKENRR